MTTKKKMNEPVISQNAQEEEQSPEGNFTRPLFTIFKDHDKNMWCVGQVNFDPALRLVSPEIKIVAEEANKELCIERFKIKVARELLNS